MPDNELLDWTNAEKHLETIEREYTKLDGVPGVNVQFAPQLVIRPLRVRFNRGERTQLLYEEIMELAL